MNLDSAFQWFMGDLLMFDMAPAGQVVVLIAAGYLLGYLIRLLAELVGNALAWLVEKLIKKLKGRAAHV